MDIRDTALFPVGQAAPNAIDCVRRYFRNELENPHA